VKLRYAIFYVENVSDTIAFYESAFGIEKKMLHESGEYGEMETGTTTLAFSSVNLMTQLGKNPGRPSPDRPTCEIAFETDDVASAFEKALGAGAKAIQPPEHMPWGQTISYVADPSGYLVEICSAVET